MALSSFGARLQMGDGGIPETFQTIAEVLDISGPALSLDTEDATSHDSPGGWEEVVPTILRSGEVTFTIQYDPSDPTHNATTGLLSQLRNRALRNFKLVFPDPARTTWRFSAYVTGFQPSAPVAGKLTADVTLKVTGQPVLV